MEKPEKASDKIAYIFAKDDLEKAELTQWFEAANVALANVHFAD